ncbi:MAG: alpha/beta hydrolase [Chloroflexota bacterium]|nr:alpha/beta hydrolase [Chloroflexota bacterium]
MSYKGPHLFLYVDFGVPLLMLHGDADEVVPFESGRKLYEAANQPKKFCAIDGAGHNDTYIVGGDGYFAAIEEFITGLSDK